MLKQVLLCCVLPCFVRSYTTTINLRSNIECNIWTSNSMYDDTVYLVKWNGQHLGGDCTINFDNYETDRRICVKATTYTVNDCSIKVTYLGGLIGETTKHIYSCYDYPDEFCGEDDGDIAIRLDSSSAGSSPGEFTLRVYSKSSMNPTVIGVSVAASVVFISAVIVIVIVIVRRRRATPGSIMTTYPPPPSATVITTNASSTMGAGYTNPNYPAGYNYQYSQQGAPPPYSPPPYPAGK